VGRCRERTRARFPRKRNGGEARGWRDVHAVDDMGCSSMNEFPDADLPFTSVSGVAIRCI
jgi:hypothetical protein